MKSNYEIDLTLHNQTRLPTASELERILRYMLEKLYQGADVRVTKVVKE